jgi:GrpB-like predicted nucleotidyltransferase (UPF0157 family)
MRVLLVEQARTTNEPAWKMVRRLRPRLRKSPEWATRLRNVKNNLKMPFRRGAINAPRKAE